MKILQNIHGHEDLLALTEQERIQLCAEIREFLVSHVARTGGHLASNLGAVELTVAIETVFNTMYDRLVFDVGHQSYVHKLLTGRQAEFSHLRQFGGMAGFPKPEESDADAFVAGHASSSISIALGMARARTLLNQDYDVVALLGDGSATGGMVYEGLNDAAESGEPMVIILNDNEMSIGKNVGGMSRHLSLLRVKEQYLGMKRQYRSLLDKLPGGSWIYQVTKSMKDWLRRILLPSSLFENMGLTYLGPVDGHDLPGLISLLSEARAYHRPVVVHVVTKKGFGYLPAESDPTKFHGIGKFDFYSGRTPENSVSSFSEQFGRTMIQLAKENEKVCAISAAMIGGVGLQDFQGLYPKRTFDVGIAEQHAVSMAGGLAKQGMIPVVAIYSTFLQRSYDQIMQDIAMLNLHVVLAVDRAGLVGEDGATHHGTFDVGFLRQIPNLLLLAPASIAEETAMLRWAVLEHNGPVAIRYPRGGNRSYEGSAWEPDTRCRPVCHRQGKDITLITYGTLVSSLMEAAEMLASKGIEITVLRLTCLSELSAQLLKENISGPVLVVEEASTGSGIREALAEILPGQVIGAIDLGKQFITHGATGTLYAQYGLNGHSIANYVEEVLKDEN